MLSMGFGVALCDAELWGGWGDLIVVLRCAMLVLLGLLGLFGCGGSRDASAAMLWWIVDGIR